MNYSLALQLLLCAVLVGPMLDNTMVGYNVCQDRVRRIMMHAAGNCNFM